MKKACRILIFVLCLSFIFSVDAFSFSEKRLLDRANKGDSSIQFALGVHYLLNEDISYHEKGIHWIKKAANKGHKKALCFLTSIYFNEKFNLDNDSFEALNVYKKTSSKGCAKSLYVLGKARSSLSSFKIKGFDKKDKLAIKLFSKAINRKEVGAMIALAEHYEKGKGVKKSYAKARKLLDLAASKGSGVASRKMGEYYDRGIGVRKNKRYAFRWYRLGAKQKDKISQYRLAKIFNKRGNYKKAAKWYLEAADQGFSPATHDLGILYAEGLGVKKDEFVAYILIRSSKMDGKKTKQYLASLKENFTYDKLLTANNLIQEYNKED